MGLSPWKRLQRSLPRRAWQNDGPQDVHELIPRTCEYVPSLCGDYVAS